MPKKKAVKHLFDRIAPYYDRLNHLLSLHVDKIWRRKAVKKVLVVPHERVMDMACGTADFSLALAKAGVPSVLGLDISEQMLRIGRQKIQSQGLSHIIQLEQGDSEAIAYPDKSFDVVTVAFGVRNYENLELGLQEMLRVLKPGGMLLVLELSLPQSRFLYALYSFYFTRILPWIGGLISGDKQAYAYLPASVLRFPKPKEFLQIMQSCGCVETRQQALSLGLARIFTGKKEITGKK